MRSPQTLLFFKVNKPSSFNCSSQERIKRSSPLIIFMALDLLQQIPLDGVPSFNSVNCTTQQTPRVRVHSLPLPYQMIDISPLSPKGFWCLCNKQCVLSSVQTDNVLAQKLLFLSAIPESIYLPLSYSRNVVILVFYTEIIIGCTHVNIYNSTTNFCTKRTL